MISILSRVPLKFWALGFIVIVFAALWTGYAHQKSRADRLDEKSRIERSYSEALDRVAEQTPIIRQEQKEKENEVSAIEGSDARLPDGFARGLQRVRDRKHD